MFRLITKDLLIETFRVCSPIKSIPFMICGFYQFLSLDYHSLPKLERCVCVQKSRNSFSFSVNVFVSRLEDSSVH